MESTTTTKQIVVDVPEDRLAEFHAFFARFLARPELRDRRRRHGRPHRGHHGRRCASRTEQPERSEEARETTEL